MIHNARIHTAKITKLMAGDLSIFLVFLPPGRGHFFTTHTRIALNLNAMAKKGAITKGKWLRPSPTNWGSPIIREWLA